MMKLKELSKAVVEEMEEMEDKIERADLLVDFCKEETEKFKDKEITLKELEQYLKEGITTEEQEYTVAEGETYQWLTLSDEVEIIYETEQVAGTDKYKVIEVATHAINDLYYDIMGYLPEQMEHAEWREIFWQNELNVLEPMPREYVDKAYELREKYAMERSEALVGTTMTLDDLFLMTDKDNLYHDEIWENKGVLDTDWIDTGFEPVNEDEPLDEDNYSNLIRITYVGTV